MKVIFAGTPLVAADCLEILFEKQKFSEFEIVGVLTSPDAPFGRNRKLTPSPVKKFALENGLRVFENIDEAIAESGAELGIIVAYGKLLRPTHLSSLKFGWINLHFSLLPKLRGAAPVQRAIEQGIGETGVSVFRLTEGLDSGPIFTQEKVAIENSETSGELFERLTKIGADSIVKAVWKINAGEMPTEQVGEVGEYAAKLKKEDARIDWKKEAKEIVNHINAYSPNPGAWFELQVPGKEDLRVVALKAALENEEVKLIRVKPAGRAEMDAGDFLRGLGNYAEWKFV